MKRILTGFNGLIFRNKIRAVSRASNDKVSFDTGVNVAGVFCRLMKVFYYVLRSFRNTVDMSNNLSQDEARRFVGPHLGPTI